MAQAGGVPCPGAAPGQPLVFKLVLLGSSSVGKSSLALRYVKNDFKSILPTVGCAFFTKELESGAVAVKLEIWDTAGQEKYHSVCRLYFRGASGAILVYDITRRDSFCKAQQWLQDLEREAPPGEVVVMLVGNKTDVGERREVTFQVALGTGLCHSPRWTRPLATQSPIHPRAHHTCTHVTDTHIYFLLECPFWAKISDLSWKSQA
ncbi:ras-related protein rab-17-like [Lynx pardinus]|uniref:Ras-related protein rab-17-like n=1 Tax=Lynx pardinus TaxID=191816 RepID=A0A485N7H5_LYNPA|nr:ras-related protein rab-17-like [Lynx pardinus]